MTYPYQEVFQNVQVTLSDTSVNSASYDAGTIYLTVTPTASTNTTPPVISYLPQGTKVGDTLTWDGQNWNPMPKPEVDPLAESTLREMAKLRGAGFIGII